MEKVSLTAKLANPSEGGITHYILHDLLPDDQKLALHLETRTLSLIGEGPALLKQQIFSDNELRVMVAILEAYPYYCPYEVLLANICTSRVTSTTIADYRHKLQEAQHKGMWRQELKPVRRAISSLRCKLHSFHLEISTVREGGCCLTLQSQYITND